MKKEIEIEVVGRIKRKLLTGEIVYFTYTRLLKKSETDSGVSRSEMQSAGTDVEVYCVKHETVL